MLPVDRREFWDGFFGVDDEVELDELDEATVEFPVSDGYALQLTLSSMPYMCGLELRTPSTDHPLEVGWDDLVHWQPHTMHWTELDLIGRCTALRTPGLPHPGLPMVLLSRFAVLGDGDDADAAMALLRSAFDSVGPALRRVTATERLDLFDRRAAGVEWRRDPRGLHPVQEQGTGWRLSSLRDHDGFPHEQWNTMIERARRFCSETVDRPWRTPAVRELAEWIVATGRLDGNAARLARLLEREGCDVPAILTALGEPAGACWVIELLAGAEQGALVAACSGPDAWTPPVRHVIKITMLAGADWADSPARSAWRTIRARLIEADLGTAEPGASTFSRAEPSRHTFEVTVFDDLERGLRIVQEELVGMSAIVTVDQP